MNYKVILRTMGLTLNIEAFCMFLPLVCALIYGETEVYIFALCIVLCFLAGFLLTFRTSRNKIVYTREGMIGVALSWIVMSVFGAIPFIVSGYIPNFFDAFFETVSGFTTTGASILRDVEVLPKSLIFWRSFTHWIGGMGVLVFIIAILPPSGGSNLQFMKAESPGPVVSKLVPKVKTSAEILYKMYIVLTVIQVVLLLLGGMEPFEALTLTFGTAGTGGFAILNSGAASYSSYSQIVIAVFMMLFGVDFTAYYFIRMRRFKDALSSEEVRAYFGIIFFAVVLICFNCRGLYGSLFDNVKHTFFQVSSIITTTGYSTVDFNLWPEFSKAILLLLMFIGACAGSTGGGIKVCRVLILLKSIAKEIKTAAHPKSISKITMNGRMVEHETVRTVNVFMASYLAVFVASMLIISFDNMDFTTNFSAIAATLNNIGPGFGKVGPTSNFSAYSNLSKLVMSIDMLIGRLEIFPMFILFSPYTWKK